MPDNLRSAFLDNVERLRGQRPLEGIDYYFARLYADDTGEMFQSIYTHWVAFTDTRPRREIREASVVSVANVISRCAEMGRPALVVNEPIDIMTWFHFGGFALVTKPIAEEHLPRLCAPREVLSDSSGLGYVCAKDLSADKLRHAPSPPLRLKVIKRDRGRCVLCGRSPADHVDVELHVHHLVPWGEGGITDEANLVTLCHTCHKGLRPHNDPAVRQLLRSDEFIVPDYRDDLARYQAALNAATLVDEDAETDAID
jgi:hypothetical protein